MLEPISVTKAATAATAAALLGLGNPALAEYIQPSSAVSQAACRLLLGVAMSVMSERQRSQSLFGIKDALLSELSSVVSDLHVDEDQEPVLPRALYNARNFILALPDDLPDPTFCIDPDGEISVTWRISQTRIFSASISESERIACAWMNGSDRGHSVERFRVCALPDMLISALRTLVKDDPIALRVA